MLAPLMLEPEYRALNMLSRTLDRRGVDYRVTGVTN